MVIPHVMMLKWGLVTNQADAVYFHRVYGEISRRCEEIV